MEMDRDQLAKIVAEKVAEALRDAPASGGGAVSATGVASGVTDGEGIFSDMNAAIEAAWADQRKYLRMDMDTRGRIVSGIREGIKPLIPEMAELAVSESGMGRVDHRILKNMLTLEKTPGIEDLQNIAWAGDNGLSLVELSPFGVIGAITPVTNPTETVLNNGIGMLAAGNAVVFSPHPSAVKTTVWLVRKMNRIISGICGLNNLVVTLDRADMQAVSDMMKHEKINLLVATGGPGIVKTVLSSGKKAIGAGAGNPPVIVDETADIEAAAHDIVAGASFDNNLPCIAEKEVFVCEQVADYLMVCMAKNNALQITDRAQIDAIERTVMKDGDINKAFVGKDATYIMDQAGVPYQGKPDLIYMEVENEHPFVQTELMMPILGIVRCRNYEEALERAIEAENGRRHTAHMHSRDVVRLTEAAKLLQTTIFVKNGPCYNGIGYEGEGYTCFTIAGPTGEGLTSAKDFCRKRRCVLSGGFYIR